MEIKKKYSLDDVSVQFLVLSDERLGKLIKVIGNSAIELETDGFKCLVKYIIGQQISDKARETIWQRVCSSFVNVSPRLILKSEDSKLLKLGLTNRKVICINSLAYNIVIGRINFESFLGLSNEEITSALTSIKGIGTWTAEMYLIFSLGRENVVSTSDGTIRRTVQWLFNLSEIPSPYAITRYFEKWDPYGTIASSFLWKANALGITHKSFDFL